MTHNPCPCTHSGYKLHLEDAREIKRLHEARALPVFIIADAFGISASHASNIGHGRFWIEA